VAVVRAESGSVRDSIFSHILASSKVDVRPLRAMIEYLEKDVGLKLLKHPSIASAVDDIKVSKLIFLDFYLYQTNPEQIIADIATYGTLFSNPISDGTEEHGRFVFLISTSLPSQEILETFRKTTKLKSAFFKPVPKTSLTKDWLERELSIKVGRYDDMRKLSTYLDTFSRQIGNVADTLRAEMESIELHDLEILKSMRLEEESEHLGEYLSWLLSEALAAKIRGSAPLLDAALGVDKIKGVPFQGMLVPKQILFDLYSEIAFSIATPTRFGDKTQFADVFSPILSGAATAAGELLPEDSKAPLKSVAVLDTAPAGSVVTPASLLSPGEQTISPNLGQQGINATEPIDNSSTTLVGVEEKLKRGDSVQVSDTSAGDGRDRKSDTTVNSQELLLVISPACDLQRCPIDYEILCVKGKITKNAATLADLLSQQSFFGKVQEEFKHLLRRAAGESVSYALVEWYPKQITTIKKAVLQNRSQYSRLAKLNELFGQEIKEEALRQLGRVGVPVDPSFSSALGATLRIKLEKRKCLIEELPDTDFVSGIFVSANEQNDAKITLSEEFISFLENTVEKVQQPPTPALSDKNLLALTSLINNGGQGLTLSKKFELSYDGGFTVRFVSSFERGAFKAENEIIFYPRGRIRDKELPPSEVAKIVTESVAPSDIPIDSENAAVLILDTSVSSTPVMTPQPTAD